jgi:hypothetical protein
MAILNLKYDNDFTLTGDRDIDYFYLLENNLGKEGREWLDAYIEDRVADEVGRWRNEQEDLECLLLESEQEKLCELRAAAVKLEEELMKNRSMKKKMIPLVESILKLAAEIQDASF